jgi:hypothetical protein
MKQYDARVDAYIGKSAAFAQPVLKHIRALVHEASPLLTETIKWGSPFFEYNGNVCFMAAFKAHCAFGLWDIYMLNDKHGVIKKGQEKESRGNFGRITSITDLPKGEILKDLIRQAVAINEKGVKA